MLSKPNNTGLGNSSFCRQSCGFRAQTNSCRSDYRPPTASGLRAGARFRSFQGTAKRLLIGLGLLSTQQNLMLDEPFDGLDLKRVLEVVPLLREIFAGERMRVLSTCQLADAEGVCDPFILRSTGNLVGRGTLFIVPPPVKIGLNEPILFSNCQGYPRGCSDFLSSNLLAA